MSLQVGLVRVLVAKESRTLLHEVQYAGNVTVKVRLGQFAALHTCHDAVKLLGLTGLQHVVACPHLLGTILAAKPVSHHGALVAPLIAQDGLDEVLAFAGIRAVDVVV